MGTPALNHLQSPSSSDRFVGSSCTSGEPKPLRITVMCEHMLLIRTSPEGRRGHMVGVLPNTREALRCLHSPGTCFVLWLNPFARKTQRKTLPTRTDFKQDQATRIWGGVRMFGCNFWSRLLCTARLQQQQQRESEGGKTMPPPRRIITITFYADYH